MSGQVARLVITSVPRGLDGGGGIQPVSRTAGMPPAVSQRLCDLAAYSHPRSGGDPGNPVVFQHRIESISGRRLHLLAGIRDIGASYTGRSNHLADLLVIDAEDLAGLPAGPAFTASQFRWLTRWEGEPREEPPMPAAGLPTDDPEDPVLTGLAARCPRWQEATGDAGWAGELAKAFLDGRNAVIEINASHQSMILDLFVEAARLLPMRDRWRVTFNTSEIDFFSAAWRARRLDLPLVGPRPESNDLRLVLDDIRLEARHPNDSAFSRFARGESPAPWHAGAAAGNATAPVKDGLPSGAGLISAEGSTDDAVVRERLARLREHRHRSAGPRTVASPAGDNPRSRRQPLVAIVAALAMAAVMMLVISLLASPKPNSTVRETSSAGLRSDKEHQALMAKKRKDDAEKKAKEVASERAKQAEADRREPERVAQASKEEAKKRKAAADARKKTAEDRAALQKRRQDAFQDLKLDQTDYARVEPSQRPSLRSSGTEGSVDWPLCRCDAEHLVGLTLSFASAPALGVKPLQVGTRSDRGWPVTTEVRDEFRSEHWRPRKVCHLVTENGQLLLRWPLERDERATWEDPVFAMLQNSLLFVFASNPDSQEAKPELCRRIAFAVPILPEALALDPLAGKHDVVFKPESELARRLKAIEPAALHWKLELTHPKWRVPQWLTVPATPQSLPVIPDSEIAITYEDVGPTPGTFVQRQGLLSIKTTVKFVPERAALTLEPTIVGLDDLPALRSVVTLDLLRKCREKPQQCTASLTQALQNALGKRQQHREWKLEALLTKEENGVDKEFSSLEKWKQGQQRLREMEGQIAHGPGPKLGNNVNHPDWKSLLEKYDQHSKAMRDIEIRFDKAYAAQQAQEVADAVNYIEALAAAAAPVTVQIRSLWAKAIDSTGSEHPILIVRESP